MANVQGCGIGVSKFDFSINNIFTFRLIHWRILAWLSTFAGYLMPNQILYILTILFQTIQFSISTQLKMSKTVLFLTIQFSQQG